MTRFPRLSTLVSHCALALATGYAGVATAQEAAPSNNEPATTLDSIVVTATKRAESPSKIPVAISVLEGDQLRTMGVVSVSDIQNVAPGVSVGRDVFGVNINIRGVTTTDTTSKGEQGIAFNVDGVFIGRPSIQGLSFFDIDHIEVLRGPQGTLYGKSSTGGAINVITRAPILGETSGHVGLDVGNLDTQRGEFGVNLPLGDTVAVRVAGAFNKQDGWLKPVDGAEADGFYSSAQGQKPKNDQDDRSARVSLLWQPRDDFSARLTATGGHVGGTGPGTAVVDMLDNNSGSAKLHVLPNPFQTGLDQDFLNFNGEVNYDVAGSTLTWVGAHHHFEADDHTTSNNNPLANYNGPPPAQPMYAWRNYTGTVNTDSHEVRIANTEPALIDYVVGLNYFKEDIDESDHNWSAPVDNPTLEGSQNGIDPLNNTVHTSYGVFGQATWHVTDKVGLVGGMRYSNDQVRRVGTFAAGPGPWPNPDGGLCVAPDNCVGPPANGEQKASKVTWRAGINYQMTPVDLLYASVATGYKAGGFNDFDPVALTTAAYAPEELVAYEAGYKGRLGSSVRWNSALYYYDYSKMQVSSLVNIAGSMVIYTRLIPTEMYGWENDLTWDLSANTSLVVTAAWQHSEYKEFMAGVGQDIDWSGQSLDKTPTFVGSVALNHAFGLPNGDELRLRLYSKYSSSYLVSDFTTPVRLRQDSFTRSDASLTWVPQSGHWSLQAYVQNIEDKVQMIGQPGTYSDLIPNATTVAVAQPRTYGLRFNVDF